MNPVGKWTAWFPAGRKPSIESVLQRTAEMYGCRYERDAADHFLVTIDDRISGRRVTIDGCFSQGSSVSRAAQQVADGLGVDAALRTSLSNCDACWEFVFDLGDSDETYNVLLGLSETLHAMNGALVLVGPEQRLLEL